MCCLTQRLNRINQSCDARPKPPILPLSQTLDSRFFRVLRNVSMSGLLYTSNDFQYYWNVLIRRFGERNLVDFIRRTDPADLLNVPSLSVALGTQSSEAEFVSALMKSSMDCIKFIELDGSLSVMNANGMCALHIDDFSPFGGQHWANLWPEESAHLIHHAIGEANQGLTARFEAFCPTAKGAARWWDVTVAPVIGHDGKPTGILSISRDVTTSVDARKRIEETATHNELLVREMSHRIKNLFTLVQGLIRMSARGETDVPNLVESISERLHALNRSQELSLQEFGEDSGFELQGLIQVILEPYRGQPDAIVLSGPSIKLSSKQGNAIALTLHELATNAAKYGALSVPVGELSITWRIEDNRVAERQLHIDWLERAGPPVVEPKSYGFGSKLIEIMLIGLEGAIVRSWPKTGVQLSIRLPMTEVEVSQITV